jgi:hypothetical protein
MDFMKKLFVFALLLSFYACSAKKEKIQYINYEPNAKLSIKDKLIFHDSDGISIGNVRDIVVIGGLIYVSDRSNFKIHVFDKDLHYLRSSKGFGKGPGEFTTAPYLSKDLGYLVVYEPGVNKLEYLDNNFLVIKSISPPANYMSDLGSRPVFRKNRILISAFNRPFIGKNKISDITTALIFNKEGGTVKNFCPFNKIYDDNPNSAYYKEMTTSLVANGFGNSFFVIQLAVPMFYQYDENGEYLKSLYYKPRFYHNPPDYTINDIRQFTNKERYDKFTTKTTLFKSSFFDKKNNYLYLNYNTSKKEQLSSRSLTSTANYLVAIDSVNEVIYDGKIEGFMGDVDNGIIYTVVKDNPLTINEYTIERFR